MGRTGSRSGARIEHQYAFPVLIKPIALIRFIHKFELSLKYSVYAIILAEHRICVRDVRIVSSYRVIIIQLSSSATIGASISSAPDDANYIGDIGTVFALLAHDANIRHIAVARMTDIFFLTLKPPIDPIDYNNYILS